MKDVIMVYNPETKKKEPRQKCYHRFGLRDLHMEMTKPAAAGGFARATNENGDVLVSETMLRSLLPKELVKMTSTFKTMCGCEPCITAKSQTTMLNAWRTKCRNQLCDRARRAPTGPVKVTLEKRKRTLTKSRLSWIMEIADCGITHATRLLP